MRKPKILITNDDGIHSPGLRAAAEAAQSIGEVTIAAPRHQQTGMGRSLTGNREARLEQINYLVNGRNITAFHCECSPALVVRHCLKTVFHDNKPDLLISGINYGENLGFNVTCSGTVGAALEGASFGIPSIAISKQTEIESHYKTYRARLVCTISFPGTIRSIPYGQKVTAGCRWSSKSMFLSAPHQKHPGS